MAEQSAAGLAQNVVRLRTDAGMSQQSLATAAGLSVSIVAQIEQGKRNDPRASTILALAKALNVQCNDLISPESVRPVHATPTAPPARRTGRPMARVKPKPGQK
jgi:transcriptional regulator with XRE-family HTH domain